jgi:two-component system response regulator NreC
LLSGHAQFEVCGTAQSVPMARALFVQERPDLVVIGLALGGGEGIQLIKDFATLDSDARTIVFSAHEDRRSIERAFRAGAFGYLVAHDDLSEIVTALEHVATGECYASAAVLGRLLERSSRVERRQNVWERLSDRERQVFSLIGRGFGVTRLAAELHLSVKTIETHQQRIKEKLGLHSAGEVSEKASAVMLHSLHRNLQLRNEMLGRRNDN